MSMQKYRSDQHRCVRLVFHTLAEVHAGLDALTIRGDLG